MDKKAIMKHSTYVDICDAVREKTETEQTYKAGELADAIKSIRGGDNPYTGHVDVEGLKEIGWDDEDIQFLQENVGWDEEDDELYKVPQEDKDLFKNPPSRSASAYLSWAQKAAMYLPYYDCAGLTLSAQQSGYFDVIGRPALSYTGFVYMSASYGFSVNVLFVNLRNVIFNADINVSGKRRARHIYNLENHNYTANKGINFSGCYALEELDLSSLEGVNITSFNVRQCYNLKHIIGLDKLNVSRVTSVNLQFSSLYKLENIDLSTWTDAVLTNVANAFQYCFSLRGFGIHGLNTSQVTSFSNFIGGDSNGNPQPIWVDMTDVSFASATNVGLNLGQSYTTLIGDTTLEDVLTNNVKIFVDLKMSYKLTSSRCNRASLRAAINGIADLTGQTGQTLTINATAKARLTAEDIAIATAKNWTIA